MDCLLNFVRSPQTLDPRVPKILLSGPGVLQNEAGTCLNASGLFFASNLHAEIVRTIQNQSKSGTQTCPGLPSPAQPQSGLPSPVQHCPTLSSPGQACPSPFQSCPALPRPSFACQAHSITSPRNYSHPVKLARRNRHNESPFIMIQNFPIPLEECRNHHRVQYPKCFFRTYT